MTSLLQACGELVMFSASKEDMPQAATQLRRQRIQAFSGPSGELARIDDLRKSSAEELLKKLVEADVKWAFCGVHPCCVCGRL